MSVLSQKTRACSRKDAKPKGALVLSVRQVSSAGTLKWTHASYYFVTGCLEATLTRKRFTYFQVWSCFQISLICEIDFRSTFTPVEIFHGFSRSIRCACETLLVIVETLLVDLLDIKNYVSSCKQQYSTRIISRDPNRSVHGGN